MIKSRISANFGGAEPPEVIEEVPEREEQDIMNTSAGLGLSNSHGHEKGSSFLQKKSQNDAYDLENGGADFELKESGSSGNMNN